MKLFRALGIAVLILIPTFALAEVTPDKDCCAKKMPCCDHGCPLCNH